MNRQTRSKANRRHRFNDPVRDQNFSLVQAAISAIFEHSTLTPNLRRITIDVQSGTWTAIALVTGKMDEANSNDGTTVSRKNKQTGSHKIRFAFEADSK